MKKEGKAIISIDEYDSLRKFKIEITKGNVIRMHGYWDHYEVAVLSVDEALKELESINNHVAEKLKDAESTRDRLFDKIERKDQEITLLKKELKKFWFVKWLVK